MSCVITSMFRVDTISYWCVEYSICMYSLNCIYIYICSCLLSIISISMYYALILYRFHEPASCVEGLPWFVATQFALNALHDTICSFQEIQLPSIAKAGSQVSHGKGELYFEDPTPKQNQRLLFILCKLSLLLMSF